MSKKTKKKFNEVAFGDYVITEADQGDVHDFSTLYLKALKEEPTLFTEVYTELRGKKDEYWKEMVHESMEDGRRLICLVHQKSSGDLVGFMIIQGNAYTKFSHIADMFPLYLLKEHRDADLQTKILESVFRHLKQFSDITKVQTYVTTSQLEYLAFYNYLGFVRYGYDEQHFKIGKKFYDSVLLAKSL